MMKRARGSWMVTKEEVTETRNLPRSSNDKNALLLVMFSNRLAKVLNYFFVSEIFAMV